MGDRIFTPEKLFQAEQQFSNETLQLAKKALAGDLGKAAGISTALGLVGYPLEAPSKKIYPVD